MAVKNKVQVLIDPSSYVQPSEGLRLAKILSNCRFSLVIAPLFSPNLDAQALDFLLDAAATLKNGGQTDWCFADGVLTKLTDRKPDCRSNSPTCHVVCKKTRSSYTQNPDPLFVACTAGIQSCIIFGRNLYYCANGYPPVFSYRMFWDVSGRQSLQRGEIPTLSRPIGSSG